MHAKRGAKKTLEILPVDVGRKKEYEGGGELVVARSQLRSESEGESPLLMSLISSIVELSGYVQRCKRGTPEIWKGGEGRSMRWQVRLEIEKVSRTIRKRGRGRVSNRGIQ